MISIWHALHSFLYPVVAVYYFFPGQRELPWLNRWEMVGLAALTLVFGTMICFGHGMDRPPVDMAHFILLLAAGGILAWLAAKVFLVPKLGEGGKLRKRVVLFGSLGCVALTLVPNLMAAIKIPAAACCGYFALLLLVALWLIRRPASLSVATALSFALGDDWLSSVFGGVAALTRGDVQQCVTDAVIAAFLGWLIVRLLRNSQWVVNEARTEQNYRDK